jgi:hypothetical protein
MTVAAGTMWRLELRQYSILPSADLRAREGCYNPFDYRPFTLIKTFLCWLLLLEGF